MRHLALILPLLALSACQTLPAVVVPKIVHVPVTTIVPVPAALSADCDVYQVKANTYGEAIKAANARKASLEACNTRMKLIRELGAKP